MLTSTHIYHPLLAAKYSDSSCTTTKTSRTVVAGTICQTAPAYASTDPSYALFTCPTYSYAAGGYFSTQIYSDSSCTTMVAINEVNLNQQCFWSADSTASYVSNVAQYYASDTTTTGINSYTLANSYSSSSTCSTATTTLLSSAVSSVSYTSSCTQLLNTYSASVSNAYVKYVIATSSQVSTSHTAGTFTLNEYVDSSCSTSAGAIWWSDVAQCLPYVPFSSDSSDVLTGVTIYESITSSYTLSSDFLSYFPFVILFRIFQSSMCRYSCYLYHQYLFG